MKPVKRRVIGEQVAGQRRQDTSLIAQTENSLGLEASYVWPID